MPGIIVDPRQNSETQKRYGVVLVLGNFVAYDKKDDLEELPYLPAGWKIDLNKVNIVPLPEGHKFDWNNRTIGFKLELVASRSDQGPVLTGIYNILKVGGSGIPGIDTIDKDADWNLPD
jgi:hypothetical protein